MGARALSGFFVALGLLWTGCEDQRYAGPPDPGDVEMELQLGGYLFVPVDEIRTMEQGDRGTIVWTLDDSFVVRESQQEIRERMRQAERER